MRESARIGLMARMALGPLACLAAVATVLAANPAPAAVHTRVDLVWSVDGADCSALPLAPAADDGEWSVAALLPSGLAAGAHSVQFQFMVDGSMVPAHYGQDILRPNGVEFGANPPNMQAFVDAPGYVVLSLDEIALTYGITPAAGAILVEVDYADTPLPVPIPVLQETRAGVRQAGDFALVGDFLYDVAAGQLPVTRLAEGRAYELTVTAPGYLATVVSVDVGAASPYHVTVTLQKLVASDQQTWGTCKSLYR